MNKGIVYIVKAGFGMTYKIGKSVESNFAKRMSEANTWVPKGKLVAVIITCCEESAIREEARIHAILNSADNHVDGEWFKGWKTRSVVKDIQSLHGKVNCKLDARSIRNTMIHKII